MLQERQDRARPMPAHWTDAYYGALYLDSVEDLLTPALSGARGGRDRGAPPARPGGPGPRSRVRARPARAAARRARVRRLCGLDRSGGLPPARERGRCARRGRAAPRCPTSSGATCARSRSPRAPSTRSSPGTRRCSSSTTRRTRPASPTSRACSGPAGGCSSTTRTRSGSPRSPTRRRRGRCPTARAWRSAPGTTRPAGWIARTVAIIRPGGAVLAATAELRYYMPSEWRRLAERTGLRLVAVTSTPGAAASPHAEPGPEAPDLIALLEKPT